MQLGDPSAATGQIFARFVRERPTEPYTDIIAFYEKDAIFLSIELGHVFPLEINLDGPLVNQSLGTLEAFGIDKICPGVWNLTPSFNVPEAIHAFVTIYGVPDPAPWESSIILLTPGAKLK